MNRPTRRRTQKKTKGQVYASKPECHILHTRNPGNRPMSAPSRKELAVNQSRRPIQDTWLQKSETYYFTKENPATRPGGSLLSFFLKFLHRSLRESATYYRRSRTCSIWHQIEFPTLESNPRWPRWWPVSMQTTIRRHRLSPLGPKGQSACTYQLQLQMLQHSLIIRPLMQHV